MRASAVVPTDKPEFILRRVFNASRAEVYKVWTDPAFVRRWWGIEGCTIVRCELDVRPGGTFRIDMQTSDGDIYVNRGSYIDVVVNERIVYRDIRNGDAMPDTLPAGTHTVEFVDVKGGTLVTLTSRFEAAGDRDVMVRHGVMNGIRQSLDRLERVLASSGRVVSKDGTDIAFDRIGSGPALILIDGALCSRRMGPSRQLAELLAARFTVYVYDRRGRGESGDTQPYSVEREIEDLAAILTEAGGRASVWGTSSGAVLALHAANRLSGIDKVAVYEAPLIVDGTRPATQRDWQRIRLAIAEGRRSDAVKLFLRAVGAPGIVVALMRLTPVWSRLKAVAHTLPYDGAVVEEYQRGEPLPADWPSVSMPALVMAGGKSPAWMQSGNRALASVLPNAHYRTLAGQTHMLDAKAHAPVLAEFFKGESEDRA